MKTPDIIFVSPYDSKKFGDDYVGYVGMAWDKPDDSCEHVAYIRRDLVDARILDMKNNLEEMKERIEEEERRDGEAMTTKQQILAEIERRKMRHGKSYYPAMMELLSILDALPDEPVEKQKEQKPEECSNDERIRKDIIALIKFGLNDGSAVSPGSYTTKEEALAYLEKQNKESLRDFIDNFPYSTKEEEQDWNKKLCLTCQEYEKGHKQGYTEGCTAGYNKAMKEMEQKEQKQKCAIYLDLSSNEFEACMLRYLQSAANRKDDLEIMQDTKEYAAQLIDIVKKEQKSITESKRLANEVIEYLTKCGYAPVLKDDSKKGHFHIDVPRHEDDFWKSEEYKHCRSVLGEYYMEGDYGCDTYTLYIWREKKEQKPADFPTTDEEVNEFLETHSKVEVPEKYKTPDFVFSKQEYESYPIISKDTTSVKPAEWSEEDEDMLNSCISSIEEAKENRYAYKETDGDTSYDHEIAWLKSLRNRVGKEFLQPHWKPSEEQAEVDLAEIELNKFTEKVKTFQGRYKYPEILSIKGAMAFMARMFYQYPSVARQWYERLPKSIMD